MSDDRSPAPPHPRSAARCPARGPQPGAAPRRAGLAAPLTLAALLLLTGCGASGLTPSAAARLQADVAQLRHDARAGDGAAARSGLARLEGDLAAAQASGAVRPDRARTIRAAAAAVGADLPPPAPDPARTPPPPAAPASPSTGPGDGGNGNGNGEGGD